MGLTDWRKMPRMSYISINRVAVQPGTGPDVERAVAPFFAARQALLREGDLLATDLVRGEGGTEYALISVWASRAAHDRHEDSPDEQAALAALAPFVAGPPTQFAGEAVASLR